MRNARMAAVFAAGLLCGVLIQWPSASALNPLDDGGIAGGETDCPADIAPAPDGNGVVDIDDLFMVIGAWGDCPEPPPPPCDSSGTWVNAVAPMYQCASGTIFLHVDDWNFTQIGNTMHVSGGGIPGDMIGPIVSCEAGNLFLVSLSMPAGCTVTYTLSGTFTSATHFNGTFTVNFSGFGCQNCFNQSFNISATRQ